MIEDFRLSKWFNASAARSEASASAHTTDSEDGEGSLERETGEGSAGSAGNAGALRCYVCSAANPDYMSTASNKLAPPVPVCSLACEDEYLDRKGLRPRGERTYEMLEPSVSECYVCQRANPECMSTNKVKGAPSVPVCGVECEAKYLSSMKKKPSKAEDESPATPPARGSGAVRSKRLKKDEADKEEEAAKRPRRSLNFLEDHLIGNDDANAYKSWWLGALTFYDFVYQRHGMWHSYCIDNITPRVDNCLVTYGAHVVAFLLG